MSPGADAGPDQCKGCGAPILWGITAEGGRHIPLDAKAEKRFILVARSHGAPAALMRDTYVSHFATCPKAGEFRRR
jgi:hypothetical protein